MDISLVMDERDPDAFRALYREHYAVVHRYLAARTPGDHADDLTAETFLVAWRRAADIPDRHVLPWLLNVARKVLANDRRSSQRAVALTGRIELDVATTGTSPSSAVDAERLGQRRALLTALDGLAPQDRELMLLHVWDDLPARDIAVVLGISVVAARARLSRARRRLERALTAALEADPSSSTAFDRRAGVPALPPTPPERRPSGPSLAVAHHRPDRSHS